MEKKIFYNAEGEYGRYIMQELSLPDTHSSPAAAERYQKYGRRIHWIDSNNMPGCFQMNTSWYFAPNRELQLTSARRCISTEREGHFYIRAGAPLIEQNKNFVQLRVGIYGFAVFSWTSGLALSAYGAYGFSHGTHLYYLQTVRNRRRELRAGRYHTFRKPKA